MSSIHKEEYRLLIKALVRARKAAGLTQEEVADKLGVHQSFISKIESCQRRIDVLELKKIAGIYGIQLEDII